MNMTPEQINFVLQQAVYAADSSLRAGGSASDASKAAVSIVEAAKAAMKAMVDQP